MPSAISPGAAPRSSGVCAHCAAKCAALWRALGRTGPGPMAFTRMRGASAERRRLRERPEPRLAEGVGHEVRREVPDALVDQIDDTALRRTGQRRREPLGEHEGRAQVDRHVALPARPVRALQVVIIEEGGVVDEAADGPEGLCRPRHQGLDLGFLGEIRPERHGAAAAALDACDDAAGSIARVPMMHRDRPPFARQPLRDGAADAQRGAGHQSRPRHGRPERPERPISPPGRPISCPVQPCPAGPTRPRPAVSLPARSSGRPCRST